MTVANGRSTRTIGTLNSAKQRRARIRTLSDTTTNTKSLAPSSQIAVTVFANKTFAVKDMRRECLDPWKVLFRGSAVLFVTHHRAAAQSQGGFPSSAASADWLPYWAQVLVVSLLAVCTGFLLVQIGFRIWSRSRSRAAQPDNRTTKPVIAATADAELSIPNGVMISYSHKDSQFAEKLVAALTVAGFQVWIDTKITPGEDWRANIAAAIEKSFAIVPILSPASVISKYCKEEIYYAVQTRRAILPVVHKDSWSTLKGGLKMLLQRIHWIHFERDGWDVSLPVLIANLHTARLKLVADATSFLGEAGNHTLRLELAGTNHDAEGLFATHVAGHRLRPLPLPELRNKAEANLGIMQVPLRVPELVSAPPCATSLRPADAYVAFCPEGKHIADAIQAHLEEHGFIVYRTKHPVVTLKHTKSSSAIAQVLNSDYRNKLNGARIADDIQKAPELTAGRPSEASMHNRSQSLSIVAQRTQYRDSIMPRSGGTAPFAAQSSHDDEKKLFTHPELVTRAATPRELRSPYQDSGVPSSNMTSRQNSSEPAFDMSVILSNLFRNESPGSPSPAVAAEDLFETNAAHIDASAMMIVIATAVSLTSADLADELHYAYECNKPMVQIQADVKGKPFDAATLLKGSVGMMLQHVPAVHWEKHGRQMCELTVFHFAVNLKFAQKAKEIGLDVEKNNTPNMLSRSLLNLSPAINAQKRLSGNLTSVSSPNTSPWDRV